MQTVKECDVVSLPIEYGSDVTTVGEGHQSRSIPGLEMDKFNQNPVHIGSVESMNPSCVPCGIGLGSLVGFKREREIHSSYQGSIAHPAQR